MWGLSRGMSSFNELAGLGGPSGLNVKEVDIASPGSGPSSSSTSSSSTSSNSSNSTLGTGNSSISSSNNTPNPFEAAFGGNEQLPVPTSTASVEEVLESLKGFATRALQTGTEEMAPSGTVGTIGSRTDGVGHLPLPETSATPATPARPATDNIDIGIAVGNPFDGSVDIQWNERRSAEQILADLRDTAQRFLGHFTNQMNPIDQEPPMPGLELPVIQLPNIKLLPEDEDPCLGENSATTDHVKNQLLMDPFSETPLDYPSDSTSDSEKASVSKTIAYIANGIYDSTTVSNVAGAIVDILGKMSPTDNPENATIHRPDIDNDPEIIQNIKRELAEKISTDYASLQKGIEEIKSSDEYKYITQGIDHSIKYMNDLATTAEAILAASTVKTLVNRSDEDSDELDMDTTYALPELEDYIRTYALMNAKDRDVVVASCQLMGSQLPSNVIFNAIAHAIEKTLREPSTRAQNLFFKSYDERVKELQIGLKKAIEQPESAADKSIFAEAGRLFHIGSFTAEVFNDTKIISEFVINASSVIATRMVQSTIGKRMTQALSNTFNKAFMLAKGIHANLVKKGGIYTQIAKRMEAMLAKLNNSMRLINHNVLGDTRVLTTKLSKFVIPCVQTGGCSGPTIPKKSGFNTPDKVASNTVKEIEDKLVNTAKYGSPTDQARIAAESTTLKTQVSEFEIKFGKLSPDDQKLMSMYYASKKDIPGGISHGKIALADLQSFVKAEYIKANPGTKGLTTTAIKNFDLCNEKLGEIIAGKSYRDLVPSYNGILDNATRINRNIAAVSIPPLPVQPSMLDTTHILKPPTRGPTPTPVNVGKVLEPWGMTNKMTPNPEGLGARIWNLTKVVQNFDRSVFEPQGGAYVSITRTMTPYLQAVMRMGQLTRKAVDSTKPTGSVDHITQIKALCEMFSSAFTRIHLTIEQGMILLEHNTIWANSKGNLRVIEAKLNGMLDSIGNYCNKNSFALYEGGCKYAIEKGVVFKESYEKLTVQCFNAHFDILKNMINTYNTSSGNIQRAIGLQMQAHSQEMINKFGSMISTADRHVINQLLARDFIQGAGRPFSHVTPEIIARVLGVNAASYAAQNAAAILARAAKAAARTAAARAATTVIGGKRHSKRHKRHTKQNGGAITPQKIELLRDAAISSIFTNMYENMDKESDSLNVPTDKAEYDRLKLQVVQELNKLVTVISPDLTDEHLIQIYNTNPDIKRVLDLSDPTVSDATFQTQLKAEISTLRTNVEEEEKKEDQALETMLGNVTESVDKLGDNQKKVALDEYIEAYRNFIVFVVNEPIISQVPALFVIPRSDDSGGGGDFFNAGPRDPCADWGGMSGDDGGSTDDDLVKYKEGISDNYDEVKVELALMKATDRIIELSIADDERRSRIDTLTVSGKSQTERKEAAESIYRDLKLEADTKPITVGSTLNLAENKEFHVLRYDGTQAFPYEIDDDRKWIDIKNYNGIHKITYVTGSESNLTGITLAPEPNMNGNYVGDLAREIDTKFNSLFTNTDTDINASLIHIKGILESSKVNIIQKVFNQIQDIEKMKFNKFLEKGTPVTINKAYHKIIKSSKDDIYLDINYTYRAKMFVYKQYESDTFSQYIKYNKDTYSGIIYDSAYQSIKGKIIYLYVIQLSVANDYNNKLYTEELDKKGQIQHMNVYRYFTMEDTLLPERDALITYYLKKELKQAVYDKYLKIYIEYEQSPKNRKVEIQRRFIEIKQCFKYFESNPVFTPKEEYQMVNLEFYKNHIRYMYSDNFSKSTLAKNLQSKLFILLLDKNDMTYVRKIYYRHTLSLVLKYFNNRRMNLKRLILLVEDYCINVVKHRQYVEHDIWNTVLDSFIKTEIEMNTQICNSNEHELIVEYDNTENMSTYRGLHNFISAGTGNRCYMNSVLQMIYSIVEFRYYLISNDESIRSVDNSNKNILRAIKTLFLHFGNPLNRGLLDTDGIMACIPDDTFISVYNILLGTVPTFTPDSQQDANEFLLGILGYISDCTVVESPTRSVNVGDIFRIQEKSVVRRPDMTIDIPETDRESTRIDKNILLQLPIPDNTINNPIQNIINDYSNEQALNIVGNIDARIEYIASVNGRPSVKGRGTKQLTIQIPRVNRYLFISLKRFKSLGTETTKLNTNVDIFSNGSKILGNYYLFGCICHIGNSPKSGHYIFYKFNWGYDPKSKTNLLSSIFEMNDEKIRLISANDEQIKTLLNKNAYILLYKTKLEKSVLGTGIRVRPNIGASINRRGYPTNYRGFPLKIRDYKEASKKAERERRSKQTIKQRIAENNDRDGRVIVEHYYENGKPILNLSKPNEREAQAQLNIDYDKALIAGTKLPGRLLRYHTLVTMKKRNKIREEILEKQKANIPWYNIRGLFTEQKPLSNAEKEIIEKQINDRLAIVEREEREVEAAKEAAAQVAKNEAAAKVASAKKETAEREAAELQAKKDEYYKATGIYYNQQGGGNKTRRYKRYLHRSRKAHPRK